MLDKALVKLTVTNYNQEEIGTMLYLIYDETVYPNEWVMISMRAVEPLTKEGDFDSEMNLVITKKKYNEFVSGASYVLRSDERKKLDLIAS